MTKTSDALALIEKGMTPFAASKEVGVSSNTLYVAIKRRREKAERELGLVACPCCGSKVDPSFLKPTQSNVSK